MRIDSDINGADGLAIDYPDARHKGRFYKSSQALVSGAISKKSANLFTNLEEGDPFLTYYVDKGRKEVLLTPLQHNIITIFAQIIDTIIDRPEVVKYIKELPSVIEGRKRKAVKEYVHTNIDFIELAKRLGLGRDGRVGGADVMSVRKAIAELSMIRQIFPFTNNRGKIEIISTSLIHIGQEKFILNDNGEKVLLKGVEVPPEWDGDRPEFFEVAQADIMFEDIFFYQLTQQYVLSPTNILQLKQSNGLNGELGNIILLLLQSVRGNKVKQAKIKSEEKRKELKKSGLSKEEIEAQVNEYRDNLLTYKETLYSIMERVDAKKYRYPETNSAKNKRKAGLIKWDKVLKDLDKIVDALLSIGIIKGYELGKSASGEKMCIFVLNENWINESVRELEILGIEDQRQLRKQQAKEDREKDNEQDNEK